MARAKRVSKAFGTKLPTKASRKGLPGKGYRVKGMTTGAETMKTDTGVKILTGQAALNVGRPGFKGRIPGPVDGKLPVKRVMRRQPQDGLTLPAADKITNSKVDLVGPVSPKTVAQPLAGSPQSFEGKGRKSVATPRKSPPVFSNTPGKVTRSPSWGK